MTPATVFDIGSITKPFTAAAVLRLQEQGRLSVDDPITRFFDGVPADKRGVTLHHLLTHTAGLPDVFGGDYEVAPRDSVVRLALASELAWAPGTRYRYSNVGYTLLGAVIERVSGLGYEAYLREHLLRPAGMDRTGYALPDWDEADVAVGYEDGERWGRPTEKPWADDGPHWNLRANGGLLAPLADLYRWHRALEAGTVLSLASQALALTPHAPEDADSSSFYGYGWTIQTTGGGARLVSHNGGNGVFYADFRRYLDDRAVILVATNDTDVRSRHVLGQVTRVARGLEWEPFEVPDEVVVDPDVYDDYVGLYRVAPGFEVEVRREGDRLVVEPTGMGPSDVGARSATRFFIRSAPHVTVEFVRGDDGAIEALLVHQGARTTRAERVLE